MLNDVEIGAAIAGIGFTNDNRPRKRPGFHRVCDQCSVKSVVVADDGFIAITQALAAFQLTRGAGAIERALEL